MLALVRQWERSQDTLSDFARRHGVSRDKLVYWRRRALLAADGSAAASADAGAIGFAAVKVVEPRAAGAIEVALPDGARVLVGPDAPPALVAAVLGALRPSC
jgi:transposase-like protein